MISQPISKTRLWTSRTLSGLVAAFLLLDGVTKIFKPAFVWKPRCAWVSRAGHCGHRRRAACLHDSVCHPAHRNPGRRGVDGYLGGAVATNVRVSGPLFHTMFPVILGCIIWGGLRLRDRRLQSALASA
jgi:hypothetical protein